MRDVILGGSGRLRCCFIGIFGRYCRLSICGLCGCFCDVMLNFSSMFSYSRSIS